MDVCGRDSNSPVAVQTTAGIFRLLNADPSHTALRRYVEARRLETALISLRDAVEPLRRRAADIDGRVLGRAGRGHLTARHRLPCRSRIKIVPVFQLVVLARLRFPANGEVCWIALVNVCDVDC